MGETNFWVEVMSSIIKESKVIVDVGSNRGKEIHWMRTFVPQADIFIFEPVPKLYNNLRLAYAHLDHYWVYDEAISDYDGMSDFYVSSLYGDSSSLKLPLDRMKQCRDFESPIKVKTMRLDTWFSGLNKPEMVIDLLWVDVQGGEKELIRGGMETLKKHVRYFYTEYGQGEWYKDQTFLDEILYETYRDFDIFHVFPHKHHAGNILFKNKILK